MTDTVYVIMMATFISGQIRHYNMHRDVITTSPGEFMVPIKIQAGSFSPERLILPIICKEFQWVRGVWIEGKYLNVTLLVNDGTYIAYLKLT